jgi:hypothetical protein
LRNDNLYIWRESIKLAEEQFSEKGVAETMSFLPKTLLDKSDLKRMVNTLIIEEDDTPAPELKFTGEKDGPGQEVEEKESMIQSPGKGPTP